MNELSSYSKKIVLLIFLFFIHSIFAQSNDLGIDLSGFENSAHHWYDIYSNENTINAKQNQPRYKKNQIKEIADNILLYQRNNGGWPKNYDMQAILTDDQKDSLISAKNLLNTTFDNWTTHTQVEYLAKAYSISKVEKYKAACLKGIDFILSAQYSNGGWPQFFPDTTGYAKHITFNDGVFTGIMEVLFNVLQNEPQYDFVDKNRRDKIAIAYQKGLDCLLNCQINENGKLSAWGQQHDRHGLFPQWARSFEPPSICNGESAGVVLFLMKIPNPSERVIKAIQSAVKWFDESKIKGIRVARVDAPKVVYRYRTTTSDRVVVADPNAPPIWGRYYELETHRPLFCNRDSKVVYSLAEVDRERRDGYGWYTDSPQEVLDLYPSWQQKNAPYENVLSGK